MNIKQIAISIFNSVRIATVIATIFVIGVFCLSIALWSIVAVGDFING